MEPTHAHDERTLQEQLARSRDRLDRLLIEQIGQIVQLALGATPVDAPVDERGDARGIVAAVFQPL